MCILQRQRFLGKVKSSRNHRKALAIFTHMFLHVWGGKTTRRTQFSPSPCRIQGSNSGHQGWQPLLLLAVLIISKCIKQSLAINPQSWANITAIHFQNFLSIPIRTLDPSNNVSHSISWVHHSTSWLSEAAVSSTSSQGTVKVWMWNVPQRLTCLNMSPASGCSWRLWHLWRRQHSW